MVNQTVTKNLKPFGYRNMLPDPSLFYGRELDLGEMADKISQGQSVALLGLRGIGKSSLLAYLVSQYRNRQEWGIGEESILVFIDGGQLTSLTGDILLPYMVNEAARICKIEPPIMNQLAAADWLKTQAEKGQCFVFLIDEFEAVANIPGIEPRHFTFLRSLTTNSVVYVVASHKSIYDLSLSEGIKSSEFFNIFFEKILGIFSEDDAREMVFGREDERRGLFTDEDYKWLHSFTGWHPLILSLACARLYEIRQKAQTVDWEELEDRLLQETRHDYRYVWEHNLNRWYRNLLRELHQAEDIQLDQFSKDKMRLLKRLTNMGLITFDDDISIVPGLRSIIEGSPAEPDLELEGEAREDKLSQRLVETINGTIQSIFAGPVLDNYRGFARAMITKEDGTEAPTNEEDLPLIWSGDAYRVVVWFDPYHQHEARFVSTINISDGQDADEVGFKVKLDSDTIKFSPRLQTITVRPDEASKRIYFDFIAPELTETHKVWIQVSQKSRLIQVVQVSMEVQQKGG